MSLYKNNTRQHFTAVGLGGEAVGCGGWLLEYGRIRPRFVGVVGVWREKAVDFSFNWWLYMAFGVII